MIVVPTNQSEIDIQLFVSGCCKSEFDSTMPIQLNGIMTQDEFEESIQNINESMSSRISYLIVGLIFILFVVGGIIACIASSATVRSSTSGGLPILVGAGLGLIGFGLLFGCFGCFIIPVRRTSRMRQAVANESMKYSRRLPRPCSWILHVYTIGTGGRNGGTRTVYRLSIRIGNSVGPGNGYQLNQVAPQPTPFYQQENNIPSSPPYYDQSVARFCSKCGAPRENEMSRFCSKCGHPLNS